ncbi:hypothetical protein [Halorussus caseinilyticus]|uniref:Uncharacterized protein n=1 Tax=Halorussus caseinilyticus TaxID=3034025 RepID=A0ABD5WQP5_9EURY
MGELETRERRREREERDPAATRRAVEDAREGDCETTGEREPHDQHRPERDPRPERVDEFFLDRDVQNCGRYAAAVNTTPWTATSARIDATVSVEASCSSSVAVVMLPNCQPWSRTDAKVNPTMLPNRPTRYGP